MRPGPKVLISEGRAAYIRNAKNEAPSQALTDVLSDVSLKSDGSAFVRSESITDGVEETLRQRKVLGWGPYKTHRGPSPNQAPTAEMPDRLQTKVIRDFARAEH